MKIKSFLGGFDKNFCYVVWCEHTKLGAIIDPSVMPIQIFEFLEQKNIIVDKILVTHTHHDHIYYINEFLEKYPSVNIYGHNKPLYSFDFNNYKGLTHLENINIGKSVSIKNGKCYGKKNVSIRFNKIDNMVRWDTYDNANCSGKSIDKDEIKIGVCGDGDYGWGSSKITLIGKAQYKEYKIEIEGN